MFLSGKQLLKSPLSDIHNTRNICTYIGSYLLFPPFRFNAGIQFPQRAVILRCPPNTTPPPSSWYSFYIYYLPHNQIKISDSESADAFFISWCQGVKLSWPLPVWSHRHLSVRKMAIYGGEDVFDGGHDDGGPCDHDCHGNVEIVKLNGLELSPPQSWLWNEIYPNISM